MTGHQLCEAACVGDAAKVSTLLSTQGAQFFINYQDASGGHPLLYASGQGHAAVTKQLIFARCSVNLQDAHGNTPLHFAAGLELIIFLD
jgi:ankyrin repeat protein